MFIVRVAEVSAHCLSESESVTVLLFMSVNAAIRYTQFSCHLCFIAGDCIQVQCGREMDGVVPTSWIAFPHKNASQRLNIRKTEM